MGLIQKKTGGEFENDFAALLAQHGYWAHLIVPNRSGAQPFDVIAAKDGKAYAFDCKTCEGNTFSLGRAEANQLTAAWLWKKTGNAEMYFAVRHGDKVFLISATRLKEEQRIDLREVEPWDYSPPVM
jgi:Holliday junction resolvase